MWITSFYIWILASESMTCAKQKNMQRVCKIEITRWPLYNGVFVLLRKKKRNNACVSMSDPSF